MGRRLFNTLKLIRKGYTFTPVLPRYDSVKVERILCSDCKCNDTILKYLTYKLFIYFLIFMI